MSDSATRQGAVGRQRPEREMRRIAVIFQIEHARKAGRREARVAPQSIGLLRAQQEFGAASHGIRVRLPRGEQAQKRPGGLVRGARELPSLAGRQRITIVALAPAAVLTLFELEAL